MYPTSHSPSAGTFVEQQLLSLKRHNLDVKAILIDRVKKGMLAYINLSRQLKSLTLEFQPDIIHVMYGGIMAEIVTRKITGIPIVVTFHGSDLLGEPFCGPFKRTSARYGVFASYLAALRASGVIIVSGRLWEVLPGALDPRKVWVIPCGIDLDRFKPLDKENCRRSLKWDPDCYHVLFPSRVDNKVKRFELAEEAVEKLKRNGINVELHQLNGVSNEEVPIWLNASDLLILTSIHEGSPTIVKEALACNRPVISVDVGDVRERIEGIEGCYLARPDPEDLAFKLLLVYQGPRQVHGREKMHEFSLERIADKLNGLYQNVLEGFTRNRI
jgi:glycosyltransferase involved in cell wall biosynthesis